jgi:hypothetical protein
VAIICADRDFPDYRSILEALQESLRGQGLTAVVGTLSQLRHRHNRLRLPATAIDVVLRYFTVDTMLDDEADGRAITHIVDAHRNGTVVLWTPMDSSLCSNKATLSMLSHPRWRAALSGMERELVDRVLPWTRSLVDDLIDYCLRNRDELILKPNTEFGGAGVVPGWENSDREWRRLLAENRGRAHIVQRRVRPRPEWVVDPATGQLEQWVPVWGAFFTPEGAAGFSVRAVPDNCGAVVTYRNPRARIGSVFTYPDHLSPEGRERREGAMDLRHKQASVFQR